MSRSSAHVLTNTVTFNILVRPSDLLGLSLLCLADMRDIFWSGFYEDCAAVPYVARFDFDEETKALSELCAQLTGAPMTNTETTLKNIQYVSDEFALESPLTPQTSMFAAVGAGAVGETFAKTDEVVVCNCRSSDRDRCHRIKDSDWLAGRCGKRVLPRKAYKFIHVNLSRKVPTIQAFVSEVKPAFEDQKLKFLLIPGDSELTLALVALEQRDDKSMRRLLRAKRFKIDLGIRIFDRSDTLLGVDTEIKRRR